MIICSLFKYLLITGILTVNFLFAGGQNFIGMKKNDISNLIKTTHPAFKLDKNAVNNTYKYLKYVDKISEQTILFFLSEDDKCTYVRWMSDYANLNDMIAMLNKNYKKTGKNTWAYSDKGMPYSVKLEEGEWYFTVSFRRK
jgi:hypothetical protein